MIRVGTSGVQPACARALHRGAIFMSAHLLIGVREARAVDPFEIQVYDGTANPRGAPGLELHVNHVASGRKTAAPPELPPHGQSHFTLEPSFGVAPWCELGAYFQT